MISENSSFLARRKQTNIGLATLLGLTAILAFFLGSGFISYSNVKALRQDTAMVAHTHDVISALSNILSIMKDAETGQRGYVITGDDAYLMPYNDALTRIAPQIEELKKLTQDNASHQARINSMAGHIDFKLKELAQVTETRRKSGFKAAYDIVVTDRGKAEMDAVREDIQKMRLDEMTLRTQRLERMQGAYQRTVTGVVMACLVGIFLPTAIAYMLQRAATIRRREEWLQTGETGLSLAMLGDQRIEQLGNNILKFLSEYFNAPASAFFNKDGDTYKRVASYGIPEGSDLPIAIKNGDGLLGQAVKDKKTFVVNNVPKGYMTIGSALGKDTPQHLVISPAYSDGVANAVFEFGFIQKPDNLMLQLLEKAADSIGVAVRSADYRAHLQNLLEETQRQSEELQAQSEELRVSNEELEEQSRALKESQVRMEHQQAELEQTNAQLEEQAQQLETQKDILSRANEAVEAKAKEVEIASQYKSDFLANMSHELRTPLNSSLILAKLLGDNPEGNLTDDQVKFAQTIESSGNDLLNLINDILDLSKIEAGHMEIQPEKVRVSRILDDLSRIFDPIAGKKKIAFKTSIAAGCVDVIETDKQRLEQILKNLLSNAFKFTEQGKVEIFVDMTVEDRIVFAVSDTGIGISPEQQKSVFDAFRQADGTISRRYGGTGLGLSISRELAKLLGGFLDLTSEPGLGSTFTITIPVNYNVGQAAVNYTKTPSPFEESKKDIQINEKTTAIQQNHYIDDDRDKLTGTDRLILAIEDDEPFARILYDLAHELGFQCLLANTAEDGLILAKQYLPNAVILDVGLPDHSGLSVLDRLKRDTHTRHIPVHVVSANDYAQTALSLGAIGHMLKPVKRDELIEALKQFSIRFAQNMRRVLIVEDDIVQRESMIKLIEKKDVETVGVGTAAECLQKLKESTFDCMVLDLSLPDATGYSLLETLSQEDTYAFPPVIVYTGKDLSKEEEQKLRRYSKSIIIKGAKSPERLLDEVTLFLHQVVSELPIDQQRMLQKAKSRDDILEARRILVVEDDVRNIYSLTKILEPRGAHVQIARNGREAIDALEMSNTNGQKIDLILMDVMMPEMDGITATREIRKESAWKKLPIIMLTGKAMKDDQEKCLSAGANDYMAKPLDVEKLLSLVRVWMPR